MDKKFSPLLSRWPSLAALASDLGVDYERVKKWRQRDSVPAEYWPGLVAAASERGFRLSLSELHSLARKAA